MPRVHTLRQVADLFGVTEQTIRRRLDRENGIIRFDNGRNLRVIRNARRTWVADAELARFLGETPDLSGRPETGNGSGDPAAGRAAMEERPAPAPVQPSSTSTAADSPEPSLRASA